LFRLSKNKQIPEEVRFYIDKYTSEYGKAKIILKDNKYFIESVDEKNMLKLKDIQDVYDAIEAGKKLAESRIIRELTDQEKKRQELEELVFGKHQQINLN